MGSKQTEARLINLPRGGRHETVEARSETGWHFGWVDQAAMGRHIGIASVASWHWNLGFGLASGVDIIGTDIGIHLGIVIGFAVSSTVRAKSNKAGAGCTRYAVSSGNL